MTVRTTDTTSDSSSIARQHARRRSHGDRARHRGRSPRAPRRLLGLDRLVEVKRFTTCLDGSLLGAERLRLGLQALGVGTRGTLGHGVLARGRGGPRGGPLRLGLLVRSLARLALGLLDLSLALGLGVLDGLAPGRELVAPGLGAGLGLLLHLGGVGPLGHRLLALGYLRTLEPG